MSNPSTPRVKELDNSGLMYKIHTSPNSAASYSPIVSPHLVRDSSQQETSSLSSPLSPEDPTRQKNKEWIKVFKHGKTRKSNTKVMDNLYTPKSLSTESGLFDDHENYEFDDSIKNIAVMTSGGDSCGMNAAVRAVVRATIKMGLKCYLIQEGYFGLINNQIEEANWSSVGSIIQQGGTVLGTARCAQFRKLEGRREAVYNLVRRNVNGLCIIGGDGSITGASILSSEWNDHLNALVEEKRLEKENADRCESLKFVGLVGSIDNDMKGTLNTIGADSALHRICEAIDHIATTASSHKRAFVIEVMGRECGYLAVMSALVTGIDYCFIPEDPPKKGWELEMCAAIKAGRDNGKKCTVVIVCEGAKSYTGKKITSDYVKDVLEFHLDLTARVSILGHIQRGGTPSAYDRYLATATGVEAIRVLLNASITTPQLIGMSGYTLTRADLMNCVEQNKIADTFLQKQNFEEVMKAKGQRFTNAVNLFKIMKQPSALKHNENPKKMGIMSVGAPAPGMNSFFRFLTRLMLNEGHMVYGIKDGFRGFTNEKVIEMDWMTVNGWAQIGGCMLGTCRDLPKSDEILESVMNVIEKYQLSTIVVCGGFEAYRAMILIDDAMKRDPHRFGKLGVQWFVAPATISNNLPFTTASLGCDKALNNMMHATDMIKQSSIGYCNRVFLVQVMGGYCGFLAQMGALIVGAEGVFLHERGIKMESLLQTLKKTRKRCSGDDPKLALFVNNERSDSHYNLNVLSAFFDKETDKSTSVRTSELGSLQQGGNPSPLDRILSGEFAYEIFNYLKFPEDYITEGEKVSHFHFIGVNQEEVNFFTDIDHLRTVIDDSYRRPIDQWWLDPLTDIMELVTMN